MQDLTPLGVDRLAVRATNHCLTGCGIGEVLSLAIALAVAWGPTFLVNRALIGRGRGHAHAHGAHAHHD